MIQYKFKKGNDNINSEKKIRFNGYHHKQKILNEKNNLCIDNNIHNCIDI